MGKMTNSFFPLLAEIFGVFVPNEESLLAHLNQNSDKLKELCGGQGFDEIAVKDLVLPLEHMEVNRLDNMKINTMEIIISF